MKTFTAHAPAGDAAASPESAAFIKDGFSWPALFAPLLWLVYHRMWLELALVLIFVVVIGTALDVLGLSDVALAWASIAFNILFAFAANDLRRARLDRKGWRDIGVARGEDQTAAELRFFSHSLEHLDAGQAAAKPRPAFPRPSRLPVNNTDDVIGSLHSEGSP